MTNNKLLKSSVGIIILSVVIIMIANIMLKVDKPVFLENYCEYPLSYYKDPSYNSSYCEQLFTLKYITNVNDKKTVTEIQFDGLGENNYAYASEYEPFGNWIYYDAGELNETIYGIYSVREVTVQLMLYFEKEPLDNIVINSATVYFSDGSQQQVNLGEIIFYYEKGLDEAINYISIIS